MRGEVSVVVKWIDLDI